jgi:hypothetical protein
MEQEFGGTTTPAGKKPSGLARLGGGTDSDSEEEEEDGLELQKYDEEEVVLDERDDLAIRMFMNK